MVSNEPILRFFNVHHPNKTKPYSIKYRNKYINLINNQIMLSDSQIEKNKQEYLRLLGTVKREGIDKLIEWLTDPNSCDFFTAPSSITETTREVFVSTASMFTNVSSN